MLDGFIILNEAENKKDECIITISKNNLSFTQLTAKNLKCPKFVVLGVNREGRQLGVAACPEENECAIPFFNEKKPRTCQIGAGTWRKEVAILMPDWDLEHYNYKIEGHFNPKHTEMIFNLQDALQCNKRKRITKKEIAKESVVPTEVQPEEIQQPTTEEIIPESVEEDNVEE